MLWERIIHCACECYWCVREQIGSRFPLALVSFLLFSAFLALCDRNLVATTSVWLNVLFPVISSSALPHHTCIVNFIPTMYFLQMLLIFFCLLGLLLLLLFSVELIALKWRLNLALDLAAGCHVLSLLLSEEILLVLWLLYGIINIIFVFWMWFEVPCALRFTTVDLLIACGS